MDKIPYDASRDSLYKPGEADDFFRDGLDLSDHAVLCAEMARLAYVKDKAKLKENLTRAYFNLESTIGYDNAGTQAFIASSGESNDESILLIAFRGTERDDPTDLLSDADLRKTPWTNISGTNIGEVHNGFAKALTDGGEKRVLFQITDIIQKLEEKNSKILLTGHSLGAALATLTAAYFESATWSNKVSLFTYGSPLVGDIEFAANTTAIEYQRFVNCCDLITRIPPEILGYRHIGALSYLNRHGEKVNALSAQDSSIEEDRSLARANYSSDNEIPARDLADHSPINYVSGVGGLRDKNSNKKEWQNVIDDEAKSILAWRDKRENKTVQNCENPKLPNNLVGLAISGGGIRSATFALGVLEALKEFNLLKGIDYLSTVSGGGYIGSWLSANCQNTNERKNNGSNESAWIEPESNWDKSIGYLRRYSNYLAPNLSLLSADTWSMLTIWLRNTLLLQAMIIICIATVLLIPRLFWPLIEAGRISITPIDNTTIWYGLTLLSLISLIAWIASNLYKIKSNENTADWGYTRLSVHIFVPIAMLSCVGIASLLWHQTVPALTYGQSITNFLFEGTPPLLSFLGLNLIAFACFSFCSSRKSEPIVHVLATISAYIILHLLLAATLYAISSWSSFDGGAILAFTWAPPMVAGAFSLAINVLIGIQGINTDEAIREWWSRFAAWLAIYGAAWMLVVVVAFYGPLWTEILYYESYWKTLGSGWVGTTLAGLFAGKSASTGDGDSEGISVKLKEGLAKSAPFIFIIGLMIAVSTALHLVIVLNSTDAKFEFSKSSLLGNTIIHDATQISIRRDDKPDDVTESRKLKTCTENQNSDCIKQWDNNTQANYWIEQVDFNKENQQIIDKDNHKSSFPEYPKHWILLFTDNYFIAWITWIVCFACLCLLSWRIDINEFSLNAFYRNRLVRCYLGAAKKPEQRQPHEFTGFDNNDDLKLSELIDSAKAPSGPLHIINCALNLGGSSDLGVHTRHSATFTLTPLYCGSDYRIKDEKGSPISEVGYFHTAEYGGEYPPSLGQAISVSGAAASPNMGYHTSAPVAFLMTLFNARLGWWFPNPYDSDCQKSSPSNSLGFLLEELFGLANEKDKFLAISDGGHFENLAAYELIKRRCQVIIISDGECDPKMQFEGLANLIRLSEVDLDATIKIDVRNLQPKYHEKWSLNRCAIGKIFYRKNARFPTGPNTGWLIYIKASMNGHEDTPIQQYKATHPDFPHETTGDQFYSEDQFESYRSLGYEILESMFSKWSKNDTPTYEDHIANSNKSIDEFPFDEISEALYGIFFPELSNASAFTHHADKLMEIWDQLREDDDLKGLDSDLGLPSNGPAREIFYKCSEMIQLMENVYLDLNLEDTWNHVDNRGWMKLFIKWANSPQLKQTWELTKATYGIRFQSFWDRKLTN